MTSIRAIYQLWMPLAISFELMMLEGPAFQAAIGRLPDSQLHLGAWGLTMALALLIESPVIMLLATAIALVNDAASFQALRRFVVGLAIACTAIAGLVAFTPLYEFTTLRLMEQPAQLALATRPAMQIMLLWTAAIAWRRFYQGVLVKYGETRKVTWGTLIRLMFAVGFAWTLVAYGQLPGVQVAAIAIMAAVVSEAIATTLFARALVRRRLSDTSIGADAPTQREILAFHIPLAATTLLSFIVGPFINAILARLDSPDETLAAWPVAAMIVLVIRGGCFPVQEITVARWSSSDDRNALKKFAQLVGAGSSALIAAVAFTPLLDLYLHYVVGVQEGLTEFVRIGVAACVVVPYLTAATSWARGVLVSMGETRYVYRGMVIGLAVTGATLVASVVVRLPGMWAAAFGVTLGALAEYLFLYGRGAAFERTAETMATAEVEAATQLNA